MLISDNVPRANLDTWIISSTYKTISKSVEAIASGSTRDNGMAALAIRELLRGEIAANQQAVRNANDAISMVQTFDSAAVTTSSKLIQMTKLAEQAATGTYSDQQKAIIQQEFSELADEINRIVESTEFNGNTLFSTEGQGISISIGNGSIIDIAVGNLNFDVTQLDLTTDAEGALTALQEKLKDTSEYIGYLGSQANRLKKAVSVIESDIENAMAVESSISDTDVATEVAAYALSQVSAEMAITLQAQLNVKDKRVAQLLRLDDDTNH
jgi:flagellin